jgi:L-fuconolactonase
VQYQQAMTIDAHHHFWRYNPAEFGWIDDAMAAIRRDFLPAQLEAEIAAARVDGVISVQARQSLVETEWLLNLAANQSFIRAVVGWVPLRSPGVRAELERLAAQPKLRAVRHVLQGEPDERYMLRPDFNAGIRLLREFDLRYDLLIFERHLPQTIAFVDQHPDQVFILDHIAKPKIAVNELSPWRERLAELAERPNVYCKISGLVTEADYRTWTEEQLRPYLETVLEVFGPHRLMFGSDWPACLVACGYARWVSLVRDFVRELSPAEQARILGGTAVEAYGLT